MKHLFFGHRSAGILLGILVAVAGPIDPRVGWAQGAALTPLPVVVISVSVTIWPAIVADQKGFFKEGSSRKKVGERRGNMSK
jgi:hypothetical protein